MKIVDWQLMQLFRKLRLGHDMAACLRKLRDKWLDELCGPDKDTYFFVGNTLANPTGFLVLGVFWPPKEVSKRLL
jgi:hypothetical protein